MKPTDKDIYTYSLENLVEALNANVVSPKNDVVIALSRKGPRLLEYLRREKGLKDFPVMTEHALPFLFETIFANVGKDYRIFIVDDAIYFGSTILALKDEIESYIRVLNLSDRVRIQGIYSCIKDKEALEIDDVPVYTNSAIRSGYGHFFVKEVMKDLRSLGKSLEIEFPVIKYQTERQIDIAILSKDLSEKFGEDNVYLINDKTGVKSISVLLSDVKEPTFRKLRFFVKDNQVCIVSICPELVDTNLKLFKYIGFGNQSKIMDEWIKLVMALERIANRFDENGIDKRNVIRTGVVLLNFFSSIDTFCYFKSQIEDSLKCLGGYFSNLKLESNNLSYLLGIQSWTSDVLSVWNEALHDSSYKTAPNPSEISANQKDIVFESSRLSNMETESLKMANLRPVYSSFTISEALSSMFFNQTLMIECGSRYLSVDRQSRLRFGYTFQYLWNFIWDNAQQIKSEELSVSKLHHWVDVQIDNGSIVPQYILRSDTYQWIRVFRPGENEDALLSHLGRLVVHVITRMLQSEDDKLYGKVFRTNLEGVLTAVFHHFEYQIEQEEPESVLAIDNKDRTMDVCLRRMEPDVYDSGDTKLQVGLVDLMLANGILRLENGGYIRIAERVNDKEFSRNTTLSQDLICEIDKYIQEIMDMMGNRPQAYFKYGNTINYFLRDMMSATEIDEKLKKISNFGVNLLYEILGKDLEEDTIKSLVNEIIGKYQNLLSNYEMNTEVLLDEKSNIEASLLPYLWKICQFVHLVSIMALLSLKDKSHLDSYLSGLSEPERKKLRNDDVLSYLQVKNACSNLTLWHDKLLVQKMIDYIKLVILA